MVMMMNILDNCHGYTSCVVVEGIEKTTTPRRSKAISLEKYKLKEMLLKLVVLVVQKTMSLEHA